MLILTTTTTTTTTKPTTTTHSLPRVISGFPTECPTSSVFVDERLEERLAGFSSSKSLPHLNTFQVRLQEAPQDLLLNTFQAHLQGSPQDPHPRGFQAHLQEAPQDPLLNTFQAHLQESPQDPHPNSFQARPQEFLPEGTFPDPHQKFQQRLQDPDLSQDHLQDSKWSSLQEEKEEDETGFTRDRDAARIHLESTSYTLSNHVSNHLSNHMSSHMPNHTAAFSMTNQTSDILETTDFDGFVDRLADNYALERSVAPVNFAVQQSTTPDSSSLKYTHQPGSLPLKQQQQQQELTHHFPKLRSQAFVKGENLDHFIRNCAMCAVPGLPSLRQMNECMCFKTLGLFWKTVWYHVLFLCKIFVSMNGNLAEKLCILDSIEWHEMISMI